MPDQFGLETPQEAVNKVRMQFQQQRERFNNSALANDDASVVGQALANIFGPTIRKTLETRGARKSVAQKLVRETGMSVQEARAEAKERVPRDFNAVRMANQMKKATAKSVSTFNDLEGVIGTERAQAASETVLAHQLRRMGFDSEATAFTVKAQERIQAEDIRELNLRKLKAEVTGAELAPIDTQSQIDARGSEHSNLIDERELLISNIENSNDLDEIERNERQLGAVEARMAKLVHISLSDEDGRQLSQAAFNKQMAELADLEAQDAELGLLQNIIEEGKGSLASTKLGRAGAKAAGWAEVWFGIDPADIGADTLIGDVAEIDGSAAWVSAAIRHALTGAAMSPAEAVFLQPFLATPGEPLSVMMGKVKVIRQFIQLGIEGRRALLEAHRENPEGAGKAFIERGLNTAKNNKQSFDKPAPGPVVPLTDQVLDLQEIIKGRLEAKRSGEG